MLTITIRLFLRSAVLFTLLASLLMMAKSVRLEANTGLPPVITEVYMDSEPSDDVKQHEQSQQHLQGDAVETGDRMQSTQIYEVVATGYYAGIESTGKSPGHPGYGITYSGVKARRGVVSTIAADLSLFPIGTVLYIPDYGYGVVADIGGAVKGNVIDLYFPTKEEIYRSWGKRIVNVVVIEEGTGTLDERRIAELDELFHAEPPPQAAM